VGEGRPEGSSAMPHKRNPILSERLCGLARVLRSSLAPAMENCALWHERDMSHSSVERVLLPQTFVLTDYMLTKARELLENLQIYPERMLGRLLAAKGLPFSEGLLLALVERGMSRREAHALVTQLSAQAAKENRALPEVAAGHPQVGKLLDPGELEAIFDLRKWLSGVEEAFRRVPPPG